MAFAVAFLIFLAACGSPTGPSPPPSIQIEREAAGYSVRDRGKPVLFYQLDPKSWEGRYRRSNYVHPLYGLDGEELTEDFPADHRHHRGVFWTWHQVLVGNVRAGDPWLAQRFDWRLKDSQVLPAGNGLRLTHRWHSPDFLDGAEPIAEEVAELVVGPERDNARALDFDIRVVPLQRDVRLGGSEDDKGYGGFSVRVRMLGGLRFSAAGGALEPARLATEAGDWVDFSADFAGRGSPSGVAVLVHPSSTGYPQRWILRSPETPSMQNPVWPGADAVPLPAEGGIRLRYRLVVHRGTAEEARLASWAEQYAAMP